MKIILTLLITALFFQSCSKISLPNGSYSGRFLMESGTISNEGIFQLEILDNNFHCTGNVNRMPAGGSGTFSMSNNEIAFQDENMWTADFDWNLILNGSYSTSQEGDTLILVKEQGSTKYIYKIAVKP
jgi:hypothetical protein